VAGGGYCPPVDVEIKGEMNADIRIAVVADFEAGRLSHRTTNEALRLHTDNVKNTYFWHAIAEISR
jgi:hypothetical protein